jgi:hypothetical protein
MEETGYLDSMTESEKQVLDEFMIYVKEKPDVPESMINTWYLLRFCRARKFDMKKMKIMFDNFIAWKKEKGVLDAGQVDMDQFTNIKEHYCHGYYNTDKLGRPMYIEKVNELNPKEMFKNYTDEQFFLYYVQSYDR